MKLKDLYSFLGYAVLTLFSFFLVVACLVDLSQSIEFSIKALMYLGLFSAVAVIIWFSHKKIKEGLSLGYLFGLIGQVSMVFFVFVFVVWGHKSTQDYIFDLELLSMKDRDMEAEVRIARCEKAFADYKDKHSFILHDIETACAEMFIDVSRESYLNVIPALESLSRLETFQGGSEGYLAGVKVCLTAEAGQVDLAMQMANQYRLDSTAQSLKDNKHCKIFMNRQIASED